MFLRPLVSVLAISLSAFTVSSASAETTASKPVGVGTDHHDATAVRKATGSTRAYETAMATMHKAMKVPLSGNADVDFVRQMIPHHQGAVDKAKIQLKYGHDERLKSFNRWVIFAQELEIAGMKSWLHRRDTGAVVANAKDYFGDAMAAMHHGMMIDYTGDADVDFVRGMIAHHQGAVDMASILLARGTDPEMNDLANDIIDSQNYEIAWMERWLNEHTGK